MTTLQMTLKDLVNKAVLRTIEKCQVNLDKPDIDPDTPLSGPHGIGLDSQQSVRLVLELEDLGLEVETDENLLVDDSLAQPQARSIHTLIDYIEHLLAKGIIHYAK